LILTTRLTDFKALTFDCYGTLIDWETGIWDALQPVIARNGRSDVTRATALAAFGDAETAQQIATPELAYTAVLEKVHGAVADGFGMATTADLDADFGASVAQWPAFADTAEALRYLKTRFKLFILSNVDRAGIAASGRKLGVKFDGIYTAEDIGSYKPAPANFDYMLDRLRRDFGLEPGDVLHTAQSLFHDHVQARAHGLANAWIDRQRMSESGDRGATAAVDERPVTDFVFFSMAELADAVRAETA
jgi:2-haloalkanoic acid dehalogenase type II